jgi:hypothetical protein
VRTQIRPLGFGVPVIVSHLATQAYNQAKPGYRYPFPIDNSFPKMKHGSRRFLRCALLFPSACGNRNKLVSGESNEQS